MGGVQAKFAPSNTDARLLRADVCDDFQGYGQEFVSFAT